MALVSNGHRLGCNPMRVMGGPGTATTLTAVNRSQWGQKGALNNFYAGEATATSGASIANKNAFPVGGLHPGSWVLPIKAGGMASRRGIIGVGALAATGVRGVNGEATLTGSGDLSGTGALIVSLSAALSGSGTISGAQLNAFLNLAAALSGVGGLTAQASALGHLAAAIEGSGTATATIRALGALAAAITVTGTGLSTANVADAILDAASGVEANLTLRQALRLIAAAVAGKVSGAATTTVVIRNAVDDDKARITATVDSNGNRTAITYDLDG
jgi:hypothetical protein